MIYENVCWWAKKRGLTIHQIEKMAKIGNGVISRWKEDNNPKVQNLQKVANVLNVSIFTLMRETKDGD